MRTKAFLELMATFSNVCLKQVSEESEFKHVGIEV